MANLPWFLVAIGAAFAIVGAVLVVLSSQSRPLEKNRRPEPRLPNQEIRELLRHDPDRLPAPVALLVIGLIIILVGIGWRMLRDLR